MSVSGETDIQASRNVPYVSDSPESVMRAVLQVPLMSDSPETDIHGSDIWV